MWLGWNGTRAEVAAVLDQHGDRHDQQHHQLEGEEEAGQLGRHGHAAEHHEHGAGGEDGGEDDPGDVRARVVLDHDRQEPAGDDQHRRDRDDVAGPGHQRGGHCAGAAERLAHERDEAAGRRLRPGELRQRVAEQGDGDDGDDDDQRRREAGREHDPREAEVEAVGRADVGHRGGGDVDQAEGAAVQPVADWRLRFRERNVCRFAHTLTPSKG